MTAQASLFAPGKYDRQQRYRDKYRSEGVCVSCFRIYTPINPKTGRPFWRCMKCRLKSAEHYQQTGKQL